MSEKTYLVTYELTGTQSVLVRAKSEAEAKRIVNERSAPVDDLDFNVTKRGKAIQAQPFDGD